MLAYDPLKRTLNLALIWAITKKFAEYLMGADFEVFTYNNPLGLSGNRKNWGCLEQRWVKRLAWFKLKIRYGPGKLNGHTDALSQFPVESPGEEMDSNQEDIVVAPVLPLPAALHSIEEQD